MSERPDVTLRYQPERQCKRGAEGSLGSNEGSENDCIERGIDHQDHGGPINPVHSCPPAWEQQETSQLPSDELAKSSSQCSGAAIYFYDYRDPARLFPPYVGARQKM
jgi:hypothetical protein